jgi:LPS export ABC transporter protein LptC
LFLHMIRYLLLVCVITFGCNGTDTKEPLEYKGPLSEFENVELYYSENELVKVKMVADLLYEFESGDREFPKGVYMEFFDESGKIESTLKANHAYYFKKDDQWRGRGDVEVKNLVEYKQLNTEELYWKPKEKKIFNDVFVTIRRDGDVIYGEGLEATEDMSDYMIKKPAAEFEVKE